MNVATPARWTARSRHSNIRTARQLRELGVQNRDRVAVLMANSPEYKGPGGTGFSRCSQATKNDGLPHVLFKTSATHRLKLAKAYATQSAIEKVCGIGQSACATSAGSTIVKE